MQTAKQKHLGWECEQALAYFIVATWHVGIVVKSTLF